MGTDVFWMVLAPGPDRRRRLIQERLAPQVAASDMVKAAKPRSRKMTKKAEGRRKEESGQEWSSSVAVMKRLS